MIFENIKEYEPEYYNMIFILNYFLYFIFFLIKPLYDFIRFIVKGDDNSVIQIDKKKQKIQKKNDIKKNQFFTHFFSIIYIFTYLL